MSWESFFDANYRLSSDSDSKPKEPELITIYQRPAVVYNVYTLDSAGGAPFDPPYEDGKYGLATIDSYNGVYYVGLKKEVSYCPAGKWIFNFSVKPDMGLKAGPYPITAGSPLSWFVRFTPEGANPEKYFHFRFLSQDAAGNFRAKFNCALEAVRRPKTPPAPMDLPENPSEFVVPYEYDPEWDFAYKH